MKPVLYNPGGFVAHVAVKIHTQDAFEAFVHAATLAHEHDGNVERLYEDTRAGDRVSVGGVERSGLVLEFGSLDNDFELEAKRKAEAEAEAARGERDTLRLAAEHVLRHGKLGKQSRERLRAALQPEPPA